uniref:AlNc14C67G4724 protein n=1 Tax=Albugo laibachii Nc14 TaxID=890382 RepID=F0WDK4_9STRA|nr:AlNc14C67G4724 [Albugo laibachii Nc14]|eukprot:CCA19278.1 AlNc14C67G4724 [Albugo laibachii Nc14]
MKLCWSQLNLLLHTVFSQPEKKCPLSDTIKCTEKVQARIRSLHPNYQEFVMGRFDRKAYSCDKQVGLPAVSFSIQPRGDARDCSTF